MPVIKSLPSPEVIRGFRGILDFYIWKGLNCVRKWPHIPPSSRTPASMASAALFGAVVQGYALLGGALKTLFDQDAADQPRTGRDLYMSATYGHLHEAGMSDFLDLLTEATAYLATLADLTHALETQHTDRLLVRGMDQLFSYQKSLTATADGNIADDNGFMESATPPAGSVWHLSNIGAICIPSATTARNYRFISNAFSYFIEDDTTGWAAAVWSHIRPDFWLHNLDTIKCYFIGANAGDYCRIDLLGSIMTLET